MSSKRAVDAQHYTLLTAAVVCAAGACAGFDRGWARGHDSNYRPGSDLAPGVDLKVSLGWWNATTSLQISDWAPTQITFQGAADKSLGTIACVIIGISGLFALHLLLSTLFDSWYPRALKVDEKTESTVSIILAAAVFAVSLALYLDLAIGADHELKANFKRGLICWPDWAFIFALVASGCWALLARTALLAGRHSDPDGYLPI